MPSPLQEVIAGGKARLSAYQQTTVHDIAAAAGVADGTV
jgi:AcrR family transcriptional regulator